ncbi:MAG: FkbM family methyltransferase [Thermoflexales bacterium]
MARQLARRLGRAAAQRAPWLRSISGRFGLGRALAPTGTRERLTLDGDITIELDLSVPIFRYIFFHYDPANIADITIIAALAAPDRAFVDVGAQIGELGLIGAKYAAHAYLFEPNSASFARLERNLALNQALAGKITARQIAISSESGVRTLYTPASNPGIASFHAMADDVEAEAVRTETLDSAVPTGALIGFVKIDVEGAELDVLAGADRILSRDRPWVHIELVEENQRAFDRTCADVVTWMEARKYVGFVIEGTRRAPRLSPVAGRPSAPGEILNALFAPRERVAELARWRV